MLEFNFALYQILGERIKEKREGLNLSQAELSDKINMGRSSISNIEKGKQQTPLHIIYDICRILNIDIQSLLPTFSEVEQRKSKPKEDKFDSYLNQSNLDVKSINQIKELIKKAKNDT